MSMKVIHRDILKRNCGRSWSYKSDDLRPSFSEHVLQYREQEVRKGNEPKPNISRHFRWSFTTKEFTKTYLIHRTEFKFNLSSKFRDFPCMATARLRNLIWSSIINHVEALECGKLHLQSELSRRKFIKQADHQGKKLNVFQD